MNLTYDQPAHTRRPMRRPRQRRRVRNLLDRYDKAKQYAHFRRVEERKAQRAEARRKSDEELLAKANEVRAAIEASLNEREAKRQARLTRWGWLPWVHS